MNKKRGVIKNEKFKDENDKIVGFIMNNKYFPNWVAYNGELPDGTKAKYSINPDDLFIIATTN